MADSGNEVKMYSDFKSPYAYLAFDPAMALPKRFNVSVRWIPFQLRVKGKGGLDHSGVITLLEELAGVPEKS